MKTRNLIVFVLCIAFFSCEKDILDQDRTKTLIESHTITDGMIQLGKRINDPFAIYNMETAFSNLKSAGEYTPVEEIKPNKKYLRFLPKDEAEWDLLKSDTSFVLFDFPLDYEIEVNGTYYHDPELPNTVITWQYTVLPIDKEIPDIHHEILYEVFIPSFDSLEIDDNLKKASIADNFYTNLVYESFRITNNIKDETESSLKSSKGIFNPKRWHPSGRITVQDDLLGNIPLEGANVHARWSTHMEDAITDSDGRFRMGGFIFEVNYSIKWDRYHYSIRSGTSGQAWYNGPKQKGAWNLHITSGASVFYAIIHRAAHHYYYGNTGGIKRPPLNNFWDAQMKIAAMNEPNDDVNGRHAASLRVMGIFNWIKIWNPQHRDDDLYGTTVHELGHASHWEMDHSKYNDTDTKVKESWARGIQWHLTRMVYADYTPNYFGNYTGIVEDMVDGIGGYDQVTGYTMLEIENAIKGQTTWNSWRDNIINRYDNETENNLAALFNRW